MKTVFCRLPVLLLAVITLRAEVPFDRLLRAIDEPQNWLTYSGTLSSQRYSKLAQITPENVASLELQWVYQASSREPSGTKFEATPLVVNGTMYTVRPPNDVVALDAATGEVRWTKVYPVAEPALTCCGRVNRGLAILGNTLFMGTIDGHLVALDVADGRTIWDVVVGRSQAGYSLTHAPLVIKNMVIAGPAGGEFGIRGFLAAFDAGTGKELWRFYTVPGPGEQGFESWSGESWKTGGGPIWMTGSYDAETNLTFWGTGNPAPPWNGESRAGDNLYTDAVIALDADTGVLKWHYQFTPHDERDLDSNQAPVLADIAWQGRPRKVILWGNKNGRFYVLDRPTGELLLNQPYGASTNWYSPSFSPVTGLFYVPAFGGPGGPANVDRIIKEPATYVEGQRFMGGRLRPPDSPPMQRARNSSNGRVLAIAPATGDKVWEFSASTSGILTTATDLLFTGTRDGEFHALHARTGAPLWRVQLGAGIETSPMTYAVNDRQIVAVVAGSALFTFAVKQPVARANAVRRK